MDGFEWKDKRGVEGTGFVRALRSLLTAHLPILQPNLGTVIADYFNAQILKERDHDGRGVPHQNISKDMCSRSRKVFLECVFFHW
jgi:hypothetical protein